MVFNALKLHMAYGVHFRGGLRITFGNPEIFNVVRFNIVIVHTVPLKMGPDNVQSQTA